MIGLYVHIPFCPYICHYCDFIKRVPKDDEMIDRYLETLIQEITNQSEYFDQISTIFIGGGTPSMLSTRQLELLLQALAPIKSLEYTIEINPDTYTSEKGLLLKQYGINRVSIGVQTFNNKLLKSLNRGHTKQDVLFCINDLKQIGISNINVDLMFAIPNQTILDIQNDIDYVSTLDVQHISYYALILENKTYFYHQYLRKKFTEVSDDFQNEMYYYLLELLGKKGFIQYEISNFSKPGFQSLHNKLYWTLGEYLGVGLGAHGFINNHRTKNNEQLRTYLLSPLESKTLQTIEDNIADYLIFGLRLTNGINLFDVENKYHFKLLERYPELTQLITKGLLEIVDHHVRLTKKGLFLSNQVFEVFV